MTQRFWLGTMGGCYVGHGETYLHPEDILWWSKGGVLHGESPQRIQWLKDFMAEAPPFDELQPLGDDQGRYVLAKPGQYYLLYCTGTESPDDPIGWRPALQGGPDRTVGDDRSAVGHGAAGRVHGPSRPRPTWLTVSSPMPPASECGRKSKSLHRRWTESRRWP